MKWLTDDEFFGTEVGTDVEDRALNMISAIGQNSLTSFATSADFLAKMQVAFGNNFDVEKAVKLASAWAQGDFSEFPEIEIRSEAEINGALGAFTAATGKIYLSREFLAKNAGNVTAVAGVLLEEFGHFVDSQINTVDAIGDEGEIFSDLVQGKALSQGELAGLKGEDDSAVVVLDGELRAIEQKVQSDTLDFFANNIEGWNNFKLPRYDKTLLDTGSIIFSGKDDKGSIQFDGSLNGSAKINYFAEWGGLGRLEEFRYPIKTDITLPNNVNNKETIKIDTSSFSVQKGSIKGSGYELPGTGLDLVYSLAPSGLSNILVKTPFGDKKIPNLGYFGDPIVEQKSELVRARVGDVALKFPLGNLGSLSFTPVDNIAIKPSEFESETLLNFIPSSINKKLVPISGKGTDDLAKLKLDIDGLIAYFFPPARFLKLPPINFGGSVTNPTDNTTTQVTPQERETIEKFDFDKLKQKDLDFFAEQGITLQDLQAVKNFDIKRLPLTNKEVIKQAKFGFAASLDILDVTANLSYVVRQDFVFAPSDVKVKMEVVGEPNSTKPGSLGDVFEFETPEQGCGVVEIKAEYELSGQIFNEIGSAVQGSLDTEILKYELGASFGYLQIPPIKGGPLKKFQVPEGGLTSEPTPIIGSNPMATLKIAPIDLAQIKQDDKVTKRIVIEKTYRIPYNLPVSVSDASVTEGDSGTKDMVFPVTLRDVPNEAVTLSYSSPKGSGSVTIAAGQTSGEIKIPVTGDETVEPDETFTLTVKDQNGKLFADCKGTDSSEATGTINDDDSPDPKPENRGSTWGEPHLVTIDGLSYDFQTAGEFMLLKSESGDLEVQTRQEPFRNEPVSINTAIATKIDGQRITIFRKPEQQTPNTPNQQVFINDQPTQIADNSYLSVGQGRIYHQGDQYTIVYPSGDQIDIDTQASFKGINYLDINIYLTKEREDKITGLFGNNNNKQEDDIALRDGTILQSPVSRNDLYGKYADSWRIKQEESLFHYEPGQSTNTFTNRKFPLNPITIEDLQAKDPQKFEEARQKVLAAGITDENLINAAILDFLLTGDESFIESAKNARTTNGVLAIASPFTANSDFTTTTVNTATKIDILANDTTAKDPLSIKEFNTKSVAGGIITLDNNNTPDDKTDDQLTYTPPPNFTGTDKFNYLLTDGKQIQAATVNVNINSLKLDNLSGNNGFVLNGTEAGNFSGVAVSKTGDINGDKIDDIIVGSFGADPNNVNAAGKSQVIFGNQKFPASVNLSQLNGQNGFTLNGTDAEGFSGGTVSSAGDINGDGIKDFIIGAFGAAVNGQNNAGKTYIVFGTNKGFPANFNLANLNGNNGFAVTGTNTFDYAGLFATGISDINGDRIDDILISAPGPLGGTPGKSYVIYGRTTGFSPNLNLAEINNNNGFVINGIDGNSSGTASSGDINGDGIPDLVIGADGGNTSGGINAGKTYVIFGQQGGFNGSVNVPELNGTTGFVIAGLSAEERSGIALTATGDINGDGNKDIVIGAPGATVGDQINAGKISVIFGKKEEFPVIFNLAELNGSNGFTILGFDAEGSAGNAVSYAGDVNKDGFDDLLIGASSANSNDKNNAGKTFVVFGSKEFPANFSLAEANGKNALVLNGVETDGLLGTAVSGGGDINGDGIDDIIVGAPGSLFQDSPGKSYAVFGSRGFGFANPNNGLQGTVQDDIINGTQEDDTISGRQGNDKIFGNAGQDVLSGNLNDDYLDGEKGQDILIGGDGNDSLFGGLGNDVIKGDNSNDILTGVDINAINPGIEEIDTLTGGGGSDIFVLGDVNNTYYDNLDSDYALITDFNASEDSIQLQGKADDYLLVPFSQANQTGTAIYRKAAQNELISILQGGANLSLSGNYFKFVGAG
ncbi:VWD domain-containing protein [Microcoleus sp. T3_B1]|uniref:VWD domain-containing protein n=1 Tax=Microcoleus sp. T3_B1 TaxID=3055425 RepID=UPI002FD62FE4